MPAQAPIKQAQSNAQDHADDIRDPVVDVSSAVEAGLDQLNGAAKDTRANEDGDQSKASCARQGEGQSCKGNEVSDFIYSIWTRRLIDWPKHGQSHNRCHD